MRIPSEDIPQADVLNEVVRTVEAVAGGARSFDDIADAIGKVDRQGRYYRRAAEILGFIHNQHNHSALTARGRDFIAHPAQRRELLADAVLGMSAGATPSFDVSPFRWSRPGLSKAGPWGMASAGIVSCRVQRRALWLGADFGSPRGLLWG